MFEVFKISLTFLLTVVVGNFLVYRWQQRNWTEQHRVARIEKELEELKALASEIGELGDARRYRTLRLLLNLKASEVELSEIQTEYSRTVANWNDRFNSFCVRLTLFASVAFRERLEKILQPSFVDISDRLSKLIHRQRQNLQIDPKEQSKLINDLNVLNGRLCGFSRDLLSLLLKKRAEAYQGRSVAFSPRSAYLFSTWYLLKEIFKADHPPLTINSSSANFESPISRRF